MKNVQDRQVDIGTGRDYETNSWEKKSTIDFVKQNTWVYLLKIFF